MKNKIAFLLLSLLVSSQAQAGSIKLVSCYDGDTCSFRKGSQQITVRFADVDTPELHQGYGVQSKKWVFYRIKSAKNIKLSCKGKSYNRHICNIYLDGQHLQPEMVREGIAWDSVKYSKGKYWHLQSEAQRKRKGLWAIPGAIPPWTWRKGAR